MEIQKNRHSLSASLGEYKNKLLKSVPIGNFKVKKFFSSDSTVGSTITIVNSLIGAGMLFIPFVVKTNGIIFGLFIIIFGAVIMVIVSTLQYSSLLVLRKSGTNVRTMEELLGISFGKFFYYFAKFVKSICVIGLLIVYQIVLVRLLTEVLSIFSSTFFNIDNFLCRLIVTPLVATPLFFFCLSKKIRSLRVLSFLALLCVAVFFCITVVCYFIGYSKKFSAGSIKWFPSFDTYGNYLTLFSHFGVITVSYLLLTVPAIQHEFKLEKLYRLEMAIYNGFIVTAFFYINVAIIGYFSFLENTQSNLIWSFIGTSVVTMALKILVFFELLLTYPIFNHITSASFVELTTTLFKKKIIKNIKSDNSHIVFTGVITILCAVCAIFFPNGNSVFGYSGSISGTFLAFVFPPLVYLKVNKPKWWMKILVILFMVLTTLLFGVATTIISLLRDFKVFSSV